MTKLFYMILAFWDKKANKNNTILDLTTTFNSRQSHLQKKNKT